MALPLVDCAGIESFLSERTKCPYEEPQCQEEQLPTHLPQKGRVSL